MILTRRAADLTVHSRQGEMPVGLRVEVVDISSRAGLADDLAAVRDAADEPKTGHGGKLIADPPMPCFPETRGCERHGRG